MDDRKLRFVLFVYGFMSSLFANLRFKIFPGIFPYFLLNISNIFQFIDTYFYCPDEIMKISSDSNVMASSICETCPVKYALFIHLFTLIFIHSRGYLMTF